MKSPIPAAESAEQVPILYQNPFGDGKLFLRVPSQGFAFPLGDNAHCDAFIATRQSSFDQFC